MAKRSTRRRAARRHFRPEVVFSEAVAQLNNGNVGRAIEGFSKLIEAHPNNPLGYFGRGNAYLSKGEYDTAIADYTRAIEIDPKVSNTHSNRGNAYLSKGEYDSAIADYTRAIEINPEFSEAHSNRGHAYQSKGEYDSAIADYNKAIEISPRNSMAYSGRGLLYDQRGDHERAIKEFSEAVRLTSDDDRESLLIYYNNRGASLREIGSYDEAINDLNTAISQGLYHAMPYLNRGLTYHRKGDIGRAIDDYDNAHRICPNYVNDVLRGQFPFVYARAAVDDARALLSSVISAPMKSVADLYLTGLLSLFEGDTTSAKDCFHNALRLGYKDPDKVRKHLDNLGKHR